MRLSDLGERKIINLISKILSEGEEVVGIGDDCAAFDFGDEYLLVSTDMINAKTHIPNVMTSWQIGWFIVAINLSDIAGKGGRPLGMVISLGLPGDKTKEYIKEMMKGADYCVKKYSCSIVGGDIKENSDVTLCGTVFGKVNKENFMPRNGCKPGDIVAVTGFLGKGGAGYYAIKNKINNENIINGLLEPFPRVDEGIALASCKSVTSCMDISDGLSSSLYQLGKINDVGFEIKKGKIPLSPSLLTLLKTQDIDVYKYALHFGGDYELLFTFPSEKYDKIIHSVDCIGGCVTEIGQVSKDKKITITENNKKNILQNMGYEHFKKFHF